jgi:hypothetical protein
MPEQGDISRRPWQQAALLLASGDVDTTRTDAASAEAVAQVDVTRFVILGEATLVARTSFEEHEIHEHRTG